MAIATTQLAQRAAPAVQMSFLQNAFQFFTCIYVVEVILGGPGFWSSTYLHFDLRRTLFAVICVLLLTGILSSATKLRLVDIVTLALGIIAFIVWMLLIPWYHGTDQSFALADGTPALSMFIVSWLFLIQARTWGPSAVPLYRRISYVAFITATVSALAHVLLYAFLVSLPDTTYPYLKALNRIFDANESGSLYIGPMPDGSTRVFWVSSLFIVFGLYCAAREFAASKSVTSVILAALFIAAIYVTETRALILGVPIAVLMVLLLRPFVVRPRQSILGPAFLITVLLFSLTFLLVAAASTDITALLGLDRGESDNGRTLQIGPLLEAWWDNPILGSGFGSHAAMIRSDTAPFSYEMSILALYMKVGIAGAILSYSYFMYLALSFVQSSASLAKRGKRLAVLFGAVYVFYFVFNTNPYLSNSVGVAIVFLCCIELAWLSWDDPDTASQIGRRRGI
jgi:O-Antigen ligase